VDRGQKFKIEQNFEKKKAGAFILPTATGVR